MRGNFSHIEGVKAFLNNIPKFSTDGQSAANFNLDRMRLLCSSMGNPQNDFSSIHVAGTNGKGTVCRLLASIYQRGGLKTALYTSPHLEWVEERFRVDSKEITEEELLQFFQLYGDYLTDGNYTFFEITTAIAFWFFSIKKVDIAIIETGLGGRLDATNVILPIASVITSIGIDHADILGDTLEAIATEKGGIIKKGVPVFIGDLQQEALHTIQKISLEMGSEIVELDKSLAVYNAGNVQIESEAGDLFMYSDMFKEIDSLNILLCRNIVNHLQSPFPVLVEDFHDGVEMMNKIYPSRAVFERLHIKREWYFDGAHNVEATKYLIQHLKQLAPASSWNVVLSFMSDKLNAEIAMLWSEFDSIFVYEMETERAAKRDQLLAYFPKSKVLNDEDLNNLAELKSELVIFSGSFYFYSIARTWMGTLEAS